MAAGQGFKDFQTGEVLTAADVDGYLMQGIWVFASATARDAAVTSPQEGNFAYLKDTNTTTYYTGSAWTNLDTTGMVNPMTTTGDTIYSSPGSTPVRLGIGSTGQVLTVAGGVPTWATAGGGGGTWAAWTPTLTNLTLGNGTVTARYVQSGKTVDFYVKIVLGSTSSVGTEPRVTWPVTPANTTAAQNALINYVYEDSGLSRYYGASDPITNSTTEFRFCVQNASATYVYSTQITSSIPISWGTGDTFYAMGTYEAA